MTARRVYRDLTDARRNRYGTPYTLATELGPGSPSYEREAAMRARETVPHPCADSVIDQARDVARSEDRQASDGHGRLYDGPLEVTPDDWKDAS